ncbi:unnamed protein product [Vitrella brassicaformis CCMP3155]|uniref:BLUF domain-containing protein n=1 Tax=Vitrella brassicaformis (strain CCMP3155) TaxID=1169540 RepID=A0A0G4GUL1_VITBC|nr:unnamed protein product [Vitrella brassicaformis CCMP3155]|eukprot:CEM34463.1 unnamed protein product [Vitrella brassicaformis CCMP3155]
MNLDQSHGGALSKSALQGGGLTVTDTHRPSALEAIEAQLKGVASCSRILLACTLVEATKTAQRLESVLSAWMQSEAQSGEVTGLLLVYASQQAALLFAEGLTEQLFRLLTKVGDMQTQSEGSPGEGVANVRILQFTELHGVRLLPFWTSFHVPPPKAAGGAQAGGDTGDAETPVLEKVWEMYRNLLILGSKLGGETKHSAAHVLKNTPLLPPGEVLGELLSGENHEDALMSYEEFADVFMSPFTLVLESELLWPML